MRKRSLIILIVILGLGAFLRLWKVNLVPPSLFGDELDVGYQAYSILKTGRDYSGRVMPMQFRSQSEYRAPLYLYSAVPTVALFGVSPLGVRLPAIIFGVIGILAMYFLVGEIFKNEQLSLLSALLLTISPWHIHYSRAGFEVTLLLALYLFGLYFFLRGLKKSIYFIPSAIFLALAPWAYSTAKLYIPLTVVFLFTVWFRDIFIKLKNKSTIVAGVLFLLVSLPYVWSNIYGGGAERFSILSIINNPEMEGIVGIERQQDLYVFPLITKFGFDSLFHNKYSFWFQEFSDNYLKTLSSEFLFISGDGNPRHNSSGAGELYLLEIIFLVAGLYFLVKKKMDRRQKLLTWFLFLTASVPASLTMDGSNHATRLILLLPSLIILITLGLSEIYLLIPSRLRRLLVIFISVLYLLSFATYQHFYWIHFSLSAEKSWQSGWEQVVKRAKEYSSTYKKVIVSSHSDPALLYFLAWNQYSPKQYQMERDSNLTSLENFGQSQKVENIYFPMEYGKYGFYELGSVLDEDMLYIAPFDEVKWDLNEDPGRLPLDLELVETVKYLSGEPAFYFLRKK